MVAVGHVLGLVLPVVVADIGLRAGQDFEPFRGLIGKHVDEVARLAEMLLERRRGAVETAEHEAAIAFRLRDSLEIEARAVEIGRREARLLILDLDAAPVRIVGPAVEPAGDHPRVALLEWGEQRAAMRTGVDVAADRAVLPADRVDRLAPDMGREIVAVVGDLALVAEIVPLALEDEVHLRLVERGIVERPPVDAEDSLVGPVVDKGRRVEAGVGHGILRPDFSSVSQPSGDVHFRYERL